MHARAQLYSHWQVRKEAKEARSKLGILLSRFLFFYDFL